VQVSITLCDEAKAATSRDILVSYPNGSGLILIRVVNPRL
jgi:hypothetical protein